jgi:hypothetical protein
MQDNNSCNAVMAKKILLNIVFYSPRKYFHVNVCMQEFQLVKIR